MEAMQLVGDKKVRILSEGGLFSVLRGWTGKSCDL